MRLHLNPIAILAFSLLVGRSGALAQDTQLIDAAKKEGGKVIVYGSLENETMDLIAAKRSLMAIAIDR